MKYRPEIDGLRALAVLGVMLNHFGISFLPGGFTGVDVFFVISGFVITRKISNGTFSFSSFYSGRIRRILPALLLMIATTLVLGWLILTPGEYALLATSAIAAAVGVGNFYFLSHTGYFDLAANSFQLLHTWSLGVEEQFYLVWPAGLALLSRSLNPRQMMAAVAVTVAIGAAYSFWLIGQQPTAAFYLPHARAWELGLGCLIAFLPPPRASLFSEAATAIGLGLIFIGYTLTGKEGGQLTLAFACIGAALAIWAAANSRIVRPALSAAPLQITGKISYSLYLWHWPLLAFLNRSSIGERPSHAALLTLLIVIFAISFLSYKFVETPFRKGTFTGRKGVITITLILLLAILPAGAFINLYSGIPLRMPSLSVSLAAGASDYSPHRQKCHRTDENAFALQDSCRYGADETPSIAIWADSHGVEIGEAIGARLKEYGRSLINITYSGCPPAIAFEAKVQKNCPAHNEATLRFLLDHPEIKTIIFVAHYNAYFSQAKAAFETGIEQGARKLSDSGRHVVLWLPQPDPGYDVPQAAAKLASTTPEAILSVSRFDYEKQQVQIADLLSRLARIKNVRILDLTKFFCGPKYCPLVVSGRPLLFDAHHLSVFGATGLAAALDIETLITSQEK